MTQFFTCPIDHTPLETDTPDRLVCATCQRSYSRKEGVWHFLTAEQEQHYAQFIAEYETVRLAEGRGRPEPEWYRSLPYPPANDPLAEMWRQRAASFEFLLRTVVEPAESRALHRQLTDTDHDTADLIPRLDILDLGAGNGWLSNRLAARQHRVMAADLTINRFDGLGCHHHYPHPFTPLRATFDHLPFPADSFDLMICNASFHYATQYEPLLDELRRIGRPHAEIVISDTPVYQRTTSGQQMVAERQQRFQQQHGFPSDSIPSQNFLTYRQIGRLAAHLRTRYTIHQQASGARRLVRRIKRTLSRQREAAEFPLIVFK